VYEFILALY